MKVKAKVRLLKHQVKFVNDRSPFLGFVAGYAAGKSDGVYHRAMSLIKYRKSTGIKNPIICITAPSYRILNDSNIVDFELLSNHYKVRYLFKKQDKRFILKTGGEVWFRSLDRPENIVGFDATDFIHDEFDVAKYEKQIISVQKSSARLRQDEIEDPTQTFVSTAEGFKYFYEMFVQDKIGTLYSSRSYHNTFLSAGYVWNMIFRVFGANVPLEIPTDLEQAFQIYKTARKAKTDIVKLRLLKSELMKLYDYYYEIHKSPLLRQYCGGEFVNTNGSIAYWGFSDDVVVDLPVENYIEGHNTIHVGMDFNVDPMTAVFAIKKRVFGGDEQLVIFGEAYLNNSNTYKMRDHILDRFPGKRIIIYPDMTGGNRKSSALFTDLDILKKARFQVFGKSNIAVRNSLNAINTAFIQGKIKVHEDCKHLVNDYQKVIRNEYGEIEKAKELSLTHVSDASRYLIDRTFPIRAKSKIYGM